MRAVFSRTSGDALNSLGAAIILSGRVVLVLSQVVILVLVARFEGAAEVGRYTLALAICSPVLVFAHFRLRDYLSSHPVDRDTLAAYSRSQFVVGVFFSGLVVTISSIVYGVDFGVLAGALAASKIVENSIFCANGLAARAGRHVAMSKSTIIRAVLNVASVLVGMLTFGLAFGLFLTAAFWTVQYFVYDKKLAASGVDPGEGSQSETRLDLASLMTLGASAFLTLLSPTLVRIALEAFGSLEALGRFAIVSYYIRVGSVLFQSIGQSFAKEISSHVVAQEKDLLAKLVFRLLSLSAVFALVSGFVLVVFGAPVLAFVFGEDARPSRALLFAISLVGVFVFANTAIAIPAVAVVPSRKFVLYNVVATLFTVMVGPVLIIKGGAVGAGFTWAIAAAVQLFLVCLFIRMWRTAR
ncbi:MULTISPECIES: lipopolysaccharide biosynthesis protein [unclassified Dietzia]|uniref:lipopolysaccharide biosynthesis protein n=1 Tax=unclassified Dietzia TaxID=2617939 RepID=UPI0015FCF099|nr:MULTISPECIES: hypothetical protein [unclassified Dietzia]MBB1022945.1 hypothetical protein [Dietzia sp. DQ12-76]MBB1029201.1 hypothetical protein [Dietzia sp. DQ11-38-2]